ncbi:MAG TPA: tRNA1(Val) (adenine(37)-N6)-methyltransferase [Candidatus Binatia bacterium]
MGSTARLPPSPLTGREDVVNLSGETLDALFDGRLSLYQSRSGYRFSIDALLLADFVSIKRGDRVVDLGAGNGILSLVLAQSHPSAALVGIEIQASMVERAERNVRLNRLQRRVQIVSGDVRLGQALAAPASFDVAVSNPPYRKPSSGRVGANHERQMARHEMTGDLGDFLRAGAFFLREKGQMALIYPAVRSADLIFALRQARIEPKRLRMVHSFQGGEASLLLVEGVKGGRAGLTVLPPLIIYRGGKKYSDEVAAILAGARK